MVAACARPASVGVVPPSAQIVVDVRTAVDTVARIARVAVRLDGDTTLRALDPSVPGEFRGDLPAGATYATLVVTVPEHWVTETRVLLPSERPARFSIRLRALIPRDSITRPRVVGDFNGFAQATAVPLQRGADGRLRADVPFTGLSTRFHIYGIGGPDEGAWMPVREYGLARDSSPRAAYAGVLTPVRDTLHFVVDPAAFGPAYRIPSAITTHTADSTVSRVNQLALERWDAQFNRGLLTALRPTDTDSTWSRAIARARAFTGPTQDPRVRTAAYTSLLSLFDIRGPRPVDEARAFLAAIQPGSPALREGDVLNAASMAIAFRDTMPVVGAADSTRRLREGQALQRAYMMPLARDRTLPSALRAQAYANLIFGSRGVVDQGSLDVLIDEAVAAVPEDPTIKSIPASFGRLRVLREGAPFPKFTMRALGDTLAAPISNASFLGKVTLIDFWGMWCAPCVEEMPVLHAAYAKYASRGFTILSIDTDPDLERVAAFRKTKWPMPWLHGWAGEGPGSPALQSLGVIGFPTAVLVDREGVILAVDTGLRGAALERTLARVLP